MNPALPYNRSNRPPTIQWRQVTTIVDAAAILAATREGPGSMRFRHILIAVAITTLCLPGCEQQTTRTASPLVSADGVTIEGRWLDETGTAAVFKGIRYAAPPVGSLRWRPSQTIYPRPGIHQAGDYGPPCPQTPGNFQYYRDIAEAIGTDSSLVADMREPDEDCLFLNVWTPAMRGGEPLPVLVWIYGGSNIWGTAEEEPYDGANLSRNGIIVVTINYRVGAMGFFAHKVMSAESTRNSSGNYGLLDQIAALRWVRLNIAEFGGDPGNVTIAGESAGGGNVLYLMASPLAQALFHRAVAMSPYSANHQEYRTLAGEKERHKKIIEQLGLAEEEVTLEALRKIDAMEIVHAAEAAFPDGQKFGPNVDGWVLPQSMAKVFRNGQQHDVPLMIGVNSDEWTTLRHYYPSVDHEGFLAGLAERYGDLADQARELYPVAVGDDVQPVVDRWQTDDWFLCPSLFVARSMHKVSSPVYFYQFTKSMVGPDAEKFGAWHSGGLAYFFNNLDDQPWAPRDETDRPLAKYMSGYLAQFAKAGHPNLEGVPPWRVFESGNEKYMDLGAELRVRADLRQDHCDLFERDLARRIASQ